MPADAPAIIESVKQEDDRLFKRKFAGKKLLKDLRSAYLACLKTRKAADGEPVPLREVHETMTKCLKARKGYKRDEFIVDMSRLVEKGPETVDGKRFELQQTKDTQSGILLLGTAGRGMVNLLVFKDPKTPTS